jgi:hypothetical protein
MRGDTAGQRTGGEVIGDFLKADFPAPLELHQAELDKMD